jgi:hypothetical protein
MSEEQEHKESEVQEEQAKALTQTDVDNAITSRLSRLEKKHQAEIAEERQRAEDAEQKLQAMSAKNMTESERIVAQDKRIEQLQTSLNEFMERDAKAKEAEVLRSIDGSDEKALLEAGFNPKYSEVVLSELKKARGIDNGAAFYKDGEGAAIERGTVIETLKSQFPELVVVNRAAGNNVPTGEAAPKVDRKNESIEQFRARRAAEREEAGIR